MNKNTILTHLNSLQVVTYEKHRLRSGEVSNYYCDMRKIFGHPETFTALAAEVVKRLPSTTTAIAASGYGGLPLGALVSHLSKLPFIGVRGETKVYGAGGRLAGYVPQATDKIVIVDDVLTSGSSLRETSEGLAATGAEVIAAVVLVRRNHVDFPFAVGAVFEIGELLQ